VKFPPAKRDRIIREIHADPDKKWISTLEGYRVEIRIDRTFGACWKVCISRQWYTGSAGTVWDALVAMENPKPAMLFDERSL
jgi:hypothetical protein